MKKKYSQKSVKILGQFMLETNCQSCQDCGSRLYGYTQVHEGGKTERVYECNGCGNTEIEKP